MQPQNELILFKGVTETALLDQYSEIKSKVIDVTVDDETVYEATDFGKRLTKLVKDVDVACKAAVEPLKTAISQTEAPYKNLAGELEKIKWTLDGKMSGYLAEKRKKQEELEKIEREKQAEALRKAQEEAAMKGNIDDVQAIETAVEHVETMPIKTTASVRGFTGASVSSRKNWKYEVTDSNVVPREYCEPSASKINAAVKSGVREIPGVRIFEEYGVSYR